jgi:hypothetical protein
LEVKNQVCPYLLFISLGVFIYAKSDGIGANQYCPESKADLWGE